MALGLEYWHVPIFSSILWIACLTAMLVFWSTTGKPHYAEMDSNQHIPYISDIGADYLRPVFIALSTATVVTFDLAFLLERWLRHRGRLTPNTSAWQKVDSICASVFAVVGAAGLILLTIFDVRHHKALHDTFLAVFILAYVISAIFICWEYQRLGIHYRQHSVLRISFWMKLFFIVSEVSLAIAFGVTSKMHIWNVAAVLEWIVAYIYCLFVASFAIDFLPALRTKDGNTFETEMQLAEEGTAPTMGDGAAADQSYFRGHTNGHTNGRVNGYGDDRINGQTNGHSNGYTNGHAHVKPAESAPVTATNF